MLPATGVSPVGTGTPPRGPSLPADACRQPVTLLPKPKVDKSVPSPYVSVRAALHEWRAIGASPWMTSTFRNGLKLPWRAPPPPSCAQPIHQPINIAAWRSGEIHRWVDRGLVRKATASEARRAQLPAASIVTDVARQPRLVVGLSYINTSLEDRPFKYETLAAFVSRLQPGDHMISWDISDALHHVPLHPDE